MLTGRHPEGVDGHGGRLESAAGGILHADGQQRVGSYGHQAGAPSDFLGGVSFGCACQNPAVKIKTVHGCSSAPKWRHRL